ncbi:MAG: HAD-IA family hydrolase [Candidatus Heimdallarchaeota archaeon]|nr:HAD-IA family hydrolase [Candidatus Heimdallarchaeota archaeon]
MNSEIPNPLNDNAISAIYYKPIKGIIFDFDGVISSFQNRIGYPITCAALMIKKDISKELMTEASLEIFDNLTKIEKHPSKTSFIKLSFNMGKKLGMTNFQAFRFVVTVAIIYAKNRKRIIPRKGARQVLREILSEDYKVVLITNSSRSIINAAEKEIPEIKEFDLVLTRDEMKSIKPSSIGFYKAMDILGLDPDEMISIGDQASDIIASRKAGIRTIAMFDQEMEFTKPQIVNENPNFIIKDIIQLPKLLVFLRDCIIEDIRTTIDLSDKSLTEFIAESSKAITPIGP